MGQTEFTMSEYRTVKSADPGAPAAWGKAPLPGSLKVFPGERTKALSLGKASCSEQRLVEKDGTKFVSLPAEQAWQLHP